MIFVWKGKEMRFEEALICMRERKEVKYRNDVYYIDKKGRLRVRYSDVEMRLIPCFTAEQIMSEDWEINMLKNKKKINILEGNVKENDINVANNVAQRISQDDELMKKIFPHKEVINGKIVSVFPYIEEVYPLKDVPQEVVSKIKKTIDHISQEEKKVSLAKQWKKGELPDGLYYCRLAYSNYEPIIAKCKAGCIGLASFSKNEEVLAPVPSWEQWQPFTDPYFKGLTTKDIAELAKKSIRLTKQHCEDNEEIERLKKVERKKGALVNENYKLKSLLKECKSSVLFEADVVKETSGKHSKDYKMLASILTKIDEVLK